MRISVLTSCMAMLGLAACATTTPAGTATLGSDPVMGGGTYSSPGGLSVAIDVQNIGGKTGVCGVWAQSKSQSVMTRGKAGQVIGSGAVVLNGEALVNGLTFLREVDPATSYTGQTGHCVVSERPWSAADAGRRAQIIIPRQIVFNDLDGGVGGASGTVIYFRPGGPSAHPSDPKPWDPA
ncbi:hypothetical protein G5B38_17580 [Pseudohalocynthiibacter aestuariivivens]|nr:hypothetical protein [Pseudohalocynthiibacter aestuariivivens]QIE47187.1 hypothetical protein G5B38_17580 [Pseudohalocynthiibacter aestuariivivens]